MRVRARIQLLLSATATVILIGASAFAADEAKQPANDAPIVIERVESLHSFDSYQKRYEERMRHAEDLERRNLEILKHSEAAQAQGDANRARQERDMERYERILDTWERQQAQYQKYLDSLRN